MVLLEKAERDWLIEQYYVTRAEYVRLTKARAPKVERDNEKKLMQARMREYYERLPRVMLSRCPFTGEPLVRAFDPWGLDGFWWQAENLQRPTEPEPPAAFRLLQGAVHLNGLPPKGGPEKALVGPEVPFVIPLIMSRPGMVVVISSFALANGYTAFPIAYYSIQTPAAGSLTQGWREQTYGYTDAAGHPAWRVDAHPWDFELKKWVDGHRVMWINPGDQQCVVNEGTWDAFPYKNLPGRREQQTVVEDKLFTSPPPNNEKFEPFE